MCADKVAWLPGQTQPSRGWYPRVCPYKITLSRGNPLWLPAELAGVSTRETVVEKPLWGGLIPVYE